LARAGDGGMLSLGRMGFHGIKFSGNRMSVRCQVVFGNQFKGDGGFGHRKINKNICA
jgi:hypothetical protein